MIDHHKGLSPDGLLTLSRLRVQGANAVSSPHTWGFPSPTAFLGFVHALQRRLAARFTQRFVGVGIISHHFEAQTFRPNKRQHHVFTQSRNPVYLKRDAAKFISDGTPPAIVEEGRAHFEVSLLISVLGGFDEEWESQDFSSAVLDMALGMRLAGGSVMPCVSSNAAAQWISWPDSQVDQQAVFRRMRRRLLPGFALVHRPDLLDTRLKMLREKSAGATVLEALLDLTGLNHFPVHPVEGEANNPPDNVEWQIERRPGWLVPLPVGYAGISDVYNPGAVAQARDQVTPFRFVESLLSLGQWVAPHRLNSLRQLLWHYDADLEGGVYRCVNRYAEPLPGNHSSDVAEPHSHFSGA